ncbi:glycosyl hydrolase family 61-domain-containing protein [Mycena crocata]|nr:glycosyl hydrolase family 61-domain-containing protein [Mycena crocata]
MKLASTAALFLLPALARAHCAYLSSPHFTLQYVWSNGVDGGYNNYVRIPPNNNPVTDVTSTDLTCNVGGLTGAGVATLNVPAGANLTFEWHQHAQRTGEDAISGGHKGPVLVYIAKAPTTAAAFNGQGAVWTKIAQSGLLTPNTMTWATDVVNTAGKHSVVLPTSLPAGEYLVRAEIIALHVASTYPGAQIYIGCAQIKIASGGSAAPPKVALPGAYHSTDPGITVNIYNNLQNYTIPGPAVWTG